jgi:hypothetical protein
VVEQDVTFHPGYNISALETSTELNLFRRPTQDVELTEVCRLLMEAADQLDIA